MLVLVPFIGNHLITESEKASVTPVIQLSGYGLIAAVLVLTVMIAPIMIAVFSDGTAVGSAGLDRGLARARGQPVADVLEGRACEPPARRWSRGRSWPRPGRSARR